MKQTRPGLCVSPQVLPQLMGNGKTGARPPPAPGPASTRDGLGELIVPGDGAFRRLAKNDVPGAFLMV